MSKIKTFFTDSRPSVTVLRIFVKFWLISLKFLKKTVLVKKMMEKKKKLIPFKTHFGHFWENVIFAIPTQSLFI